MPVGMGLDGEWMKQAGDIKIHKTANTGSALIPTYFPFSYAMETLKIYTGAFKLSHSVMNMEAHINSDFGTNLLSGPP